MKGYVLRGVKESKQINLAKRSYVVEVLECGHAAEVTLLYNRKGKRRQCASCFSILKNLLETEPAEISYEQIASKVKLTPHRIREVAIELGTTKRRLFRKPDRITNDKMGVPNAQIRKWLNSKNLFYCRICEKCLPKESKSSVQHVCSECVK